MAIEKIKIKIKHISNQGIFHDTRSDVKSLAKALSESINKINELVEEVNNLKRGE